MKRERGNRSKLIESAWKIHTWNPRWMPGRVRAAMKYAALRALTVGRPGNTVELTIDSGQRMLLDPADFVECHIAQFGSWEGPIYSAVRPLVEAGETVFDVGGHVGYSTVLFANWVGETGHVWCFEPFAPHQRRIESNIAANGFQERVTVVRAAASAVTGRAAFDSPGRLDTGVGALREYPVDTSMRVDTVSLDDVIDKEGIKSVALCKVDIEGAEGAALRGMRRALRDRRIRAFLFEFHPEAMKQFGDTVPAMVGELERHGFAIRFWNGSAFSGDARTGVATYAIALAQESMTRLSLL
jgi:FkbM family methyltransferase